MTSEPELTDGQRAALRYLTNLAERRCPTCEKRVESLEQARRCMYANPCGHRIGQGDAKEIMKIWEEEGIA